MLKEIKNECDLSAHPDLLVTLFKNSGYVCGRLFSGSRLFSPQLMVFGDVSDHSKLVSKNPNRSSNERLLGRFQIIKKIDDNEPYLHIWGLSNEAVGQMFSWIRKTFSSQKAYNLISNASLNAQVVLGNGSLASFKNKVWAISDLLKIMKNINGRKEIPFTPYSYINDKEGRLFSNKSIVYYPDFDLLSSGADHDQARLKLGLAPTGQTIGGIWAKRTDLKIISVRMEKSESINLDSGILNKFANALIAAGEPVDTDIWINPYSDKFQRYKIGELVEFK